MGLRVPGWDPGASGARPQAAVWVFDLRTSWHLEKLLVPGWGLSPSAVCQLRWAFASVSCGGSFCYYPRGGARLQKVIPPGPCSWELAAGSQGSSQGGQAPGAILQRVME